MDTSQNRRIAVIVLAGTALGALALFLYRRRKLSEVAEGLKEVEPQLSGEWDAVDQASWESFPASDAPAW